MAAPLPAPRPCRFLLQLLPHASPASQVLKKNGTAVFKKSRPKGKIKMTITLHAQPYDTSATGFYFDDFETYKEKAANNKNNHGEPVEEYEIQFIDGSALDCDFATAYGLYQNTIVLFFDTVEKWEDCEKEAFIIAVGECGYTFNPDTVSPSDFEVDIYIMDSMKELAEQFVDEGLYGEIPKALQYYIDYEAIARDLNIDYSETVIAGRRLIYRCN